MEWCGWESIAAAMDFHKKIHSDRHRPTPVFIIACFFSTVKLFCGISGKWGGIFGKKAKKTSRRQRKSFLLQQFFKNAGEVWASSPHLRSKLFLQWLQPMSRRQIKVFWSNNFYLPAEQIKLHNKRKQTSKSKSKEPQLPSKSKGCKYETRFQGQLWFPRQAGDVPQPCRTGFEWFS